MMEKCGPSNVRRCMGSHDKIQKLVQTHYMFWFIECNPDERP